MDTGVWVLEVERLYIVTVSVFDKDNNPILVTDVRLAGTCYVF